MRLALLLLFAPVLLNAAEFAIDHVTVAGRDLKELQARLASVGIRADYGGPHANRATEMALASFPDGSYLELIALQPGRSATGDAWAVQLENDAGPTAWAARAKDIAAEVKRLRDAGVAAHDPSKGGRQRPDGKRIEWETALIGEPPAGSFFPFLIADLTPRPLRAFATGKPTTKDFSGVSRVVIAVRNLEDAVKLYRKAYGLPAPIKQVDREFGAQLALVGSAPVVLAAPLGANSWLWQRLERFGEGPCAFILSGRNTGRYQAGSKTRWFGADIAWFDESKLGWRLGFE